jgi:two-component system sensor histidine kinase CiaH
MQSFAKLRNNLTAMYTLVTAGITIIVAILLYVAMSVNLESNASQSLEVTAQQLASSYELSQSLPSQSDGSDFSDNYSEIKSTLVNNEMTFDIWNDNFDVADSSQNQPVGTDILFSFIQKYFRERNTDCLLTNYASGDLNLKICTYGYVSASGRLTVVQVSKDLAAERQVLVGSVRYMAAVIVVGVVLSALGGYFLAGKALKPIRKSFEMQRDFLADASHELRTPVTVIQTNLEVLKNNREASVDSQIEWVDNAYSETKRMKDVVESLLFLAKADAGERISKFEPVDLSYLIMTITERLQGLADRKDIRLTSEIESAELFVNGDEKRLTELLTILIDNAVKYTNNDGSVTVIAQRDADNIKITVADTGIGIPADQTQRIFERFYRVDKARSRAEGGTGLGLSIAKWITEQHHASIEVSSIEGEGTKMILTFPSFSLDGFEFDDEE